VVRGFNHIMNVTILINPWAEIVGRPFDIEIDLTLVYGWWDVKGELCFRPPIKQPLIGFCWVAGLVNFHLGNFELVLDIY
jgi:hypothetical protein